MSASILPIAERGRSRPPELGSVALRTRMPAIQAFTLIEMLVVIAVIGIIAGIVLGVLPSVTNSRTTKVVQAQLNHYATAISVYQGEKGFYPPSDANELYNSLFYELTGATTEIVNGQPAAFTTALVPGHRVPLADINSTFGVGGVINSSESGGKSYVSGLRSSAYTALDSPPHPPSRPIVLVVPAKGTNDALPNVWRYNSASPTHNKTSFDLWAVVKIGNKTNIFGNWKN